MDRAELEHRFTYHPPTSDQPTRYEQIRAGALEFALKINDLCPDSPEFTKAIGFLDSCVFHANASIARRDKYGFFF